MAQPLAALDDRGSAELIRYDVPEPISYSGRNFLAIAGLPPEAFATVVVPAPPVAPRLADAPQAAQIIDGLPRSAPASDVITGAADLAGAGQAPPRAAASVAASIVAPAGVALAGGEPDASPIASSPRPISDRLATLTNADVRAAATTGQQVVIFPDVSGRLNYRLVPQTSAALALPALPREGGDPGGSGGLVDKSPDVTIQIGSPAPNAALHGSAAGVTFTVSGSWSAAYAHDIAVVLVVDGGADTPLTPAQDGTWSATVTIRTSGAHTLEARISGSGTNPETRKPISVHDKDSVTVSVALDPQVTTPPPVLPTVAIATPADNTMLVDPSGRAAVTVAGTAAAGPGRTIRSLQVTDEATGAATPVGKPGDDLSHWSVQLLLEGAGTHRLTVRATDDAGNASPPQAVAVRVAAQQPFRRLTNRLLLVETLNLSSFLGAYGAGRVIKTFSLLPGEKTTISVKSWTKSAESSKAGSSIVDSNATEAASDFEDALSAEQTNKESQDEASKYNISASAGASWGWGQADVKTDFSGSANSAREEAVKNVSNATRKHSLKASTNRNVTINTEYTVSQEAGSEESTTREIANINVSRTLNFVFRQMNQEHITLIHLTNVRVAYYTEDLALDAQGNPALVKDPHDPSKTILDIRPAYTEVPLSQLERLLADAISAPWQGKVRDAIMSALTGIADYEDTLHSVIEVVTPKGPDGKPADGASYTRFPRGLQSTYRDPTSGQQITVPGIVLAVDRIVMRTDGVMVDTVLGQGGGLDVYSQGLQDAAVAERRMGLAERQAEVDRLALARALVQNKDKDGAALFATLFPPQKQPIPLLELVQGQPAANGAVLAPDR